MGFRKTVVKTGLFIKKYSPTILAIAGTVSTIAGVVLACKASADSAEDIAQAKEDVAQVKADLETKENADEIKACKKEIRGIRWKVIKKVGPKYLVAIALVGGGISMLWVSKMIITYWLNGTSAAYIALENKYQTLEDSVVREYGEDALERLKFGVTDEVAEIRYTDPNGIEKASMETFNGVVDTNQIGLFTLIFDKRSPRYVGDATHDLANIIDWQEHVFTPMLRMKGAINLSDIAETMRILPDSPEQLVAWRNTWWIYKPEAADKDCHINLRPRVMYDKSSKNYKNGYNAVIVLDPNYDLVVTNGDYSEVYKAMK